MATIHDELHALVDRLADPAAAEALDYLRWLDSPAETLSEDELSLVRKGEEEIARGEYVTLTELTRSLGQ